MKKKHADKKTLAVLLYSFIITAIIMLVVTALLIINTNNRLKSDPKVIGEVVDLEKVESTTTTTRNGKRRRTTSTTYRPVITFITLDGMEEITARSNISSNPPAYKIGDKVTIYYSKNNPQRIMIDSFVGLWLGAVICFVISVVFTVVSIIIFVVLRKVKKPEVQSIGYKEM